MKRPLLNAVLYTLLILVFPVAAGVTAAVLSLDETAATLVQAGFFALAILVGWLIVRVGPFSFAEVGFRRPASGSAQRLWWYLPLIAVEALPFLGGQRQGVSPSLVLAIALLVLCVGIAEELYFRGLILATLRQQGVWSAILISAALFGVGHLANLAGGAELGMTLLQVVFAFLFGVVAAGIIVHTGSLLIPIVWHVLHNFIAMTTAERQDALGMALLAVQCLLLLAFGFHIWRTHNRARQPNP